MTWQNVKALNLNSEGRQENISTSIRTFSTDSCKKTKNKNTSFWYGFQWKLQFEIFQNCPALVTISYKFYLKKSISCIPKYKRNKQYCLKPILSETSYLNFNLPTLWHLMMSSTHCSEITPLMIWKFLDQGKDPWVHVQTRSVCLLHFGSLLRVNGEKTSWEIEENRQLY